MMRLKFSGEFKREAVNLVTERGVSIAQAARDLDLHHTARPMGPGLREARAGRLSRARTVGDGRGTPRRD